MKDHQAITTACGAHGTALISNEGKLFMFGNLEDDVTDKSTGGWSFLKYCTITSSVAALCVANLLLSQLLLWQFTMSNEYLSGFHLGGRKHSSPLSGFHLGGRKHPSPLSGFHLGGRKHPSPLSGFHLGGRKHPSPLLKCSLHGWR